MKAFILALLCPLLAIGADQLNINTGTSANDGTGDTLRVFAGKTQTNFTTLFAEKLAKTNGTAQGITLAGQITNAIATASTVAVYDGAKRLTNSPILASELSQLSGITGGVQTNLDSRLAITNGTSIGLTLSGNTTNNAATASRAAIFDGSKILTHSAVTDTELARLSGVTGGVQTNLDARLVITNGTSQGITLAGNTTNANATATTVAIYDSAKRLTNSIVTPTELTELSSTAARRFLRTVNTYAALKALDASNMDTNVFVAGASSPYDGGQGVWTFASGSSATANDGTIIAPNSGGGRWLRQYNGELNALWFSGFDIASRVNNAMAVLPTNGGTIRIPAGSYTVSSPMLLTNSPAVTLRGDGFKATRLVYTNFTGTAAIQGGDGTNFTHIDIKGLAVVGPELDGGSKYGVWIRNGCDQHSLIEDCFFAQFATNVAWGETSGGAFGGAISRNHFNVTTNQVGISVGYNTGALAIDKNWIEAFNGTNDSGSIGIIIHGGASPDSINITDGAIQGFGRQLVITNDYGSVFSVNVSGVHFEEGGTGGGKTSVGIDIGGNISMMTVRDCAFSEAAAGGSSESCTNAIVIRDGSKRIQISGCASSNHKGNMIRNLNTDAAAGYELIGNFPADSISPISDSFIGVDLNFNTRDNLSIFKQTTNSTQIVTNLWVDSKLLRKLTSSSYNVDFVNRDFKFGSDNGDSSARTANTLKVFNFVAPHYDTAEEDVGLMAISNDNVANRLNIGNSSGLFNGTTLIRFFTTTSPTTLGGTCVMEIDANTTGGETPLLLYDITAGTLRRVSIGANDSGGAGFRVLRIPN